MLNKAIVKGFGLDLRADGLRAASVGYSVNKSIGSALRSSSSNHSVSRVKASMGSHRETPGSNTTTSPVIVIDDQRLIMGSCIPVRCEINGKGFVVGSALVTGAGSSKKKNELVSCHVDAYSTSLLRNLENEGLAKGVSAKRILLSTNKHKPNTVVRNKEYVAYDLEGSVDANEISTSLVRCRRRLKEGVDNTSNGLG
ncbi:hypothetical protein DITRI_Ditri01bG0135200 [Diplodiscus trichospermus]